MKIKIKIIIAIIVLSVPQVAGSAGWHGFQITDIDHLDEVAAISNAFAYAPSDEQDLVKTYWQRITAV